MSSSKLLPCPECGAEAFGGDSTSTTVECGFKFGGHEAEHEVPAIECPECEEVFAL